MPLVSPSVLDADFDACIIGGGAAGLACAFDCHDRKLKTIVLEAGGLSPTPGVSGELLAAEILHPSFHHPVDVVSAAALGGSTHWWAGRSMPLDEGDFLEWPIGYEEMLPWWEKGAQFLGSRGVSESPPPLAFANLKHFDALRDETWGPQFNVARRWRQRIRAADGPAIALEARVVGFDIENGAVVAVHVHVGGRTQRLRARSVVLACGGLGALRLLLIAQRMSPHLFGGVNGPLGRGYMGHLTGSIATIELKYPADAAAFACRRLNDGCHARRRIRPLAQRLFDGVMPNMAFWFESADSGHHTHSDAAASARYLLGRILSLSRGDGPLTPHLRNVIRRPLTAVAGVGSAAFRIAHARLTGTHVHRMRLVPVSPNRWRLHYHAEQTRDPANRISLSNETDTLGLPRLRIDFRMQERDFEGVLVAHEVLDADLRDAQAGALHWDGDRLECLASVRAAAADGYHQLGGACMSTRRDQGVVDRDCRVHDVRNLWIASGSVFPSSGQANPTLTIVALARRIAAAVADQATPSAHSENVSGGSGIPAVAS